METTQKLSRREKLSLIGKYLRPCWGHFAAALLCACLSMALNALTPQIIRITVDSILGSEEAKLPALLLRVLPRIPALRSLMQPERLGEI